MRHHAHCGVCGVPVPAGASKHVDADLAAALSAAGSPVLAPCAEAVAALAGVPRGMLRVVVEVGNTCVEAGARCVQKTFVRVVGPAPPGGCPVASVDFNINPGYGEMLGFLVPPLLIDPVPCA